MNDVKLMGRLTRDPDVRYSKAAEPLAIARYRLQTSFLVWHSERTDSSLRNTFTRA